MFGHFDFSHHAPAPKEISADDRALIAAAIAAGMVRRIPTGASAFPGYRWDEGRQTLVMARGPGSGAGAAPFGAQVEKNRANGDANMVAVDHLGRKGLSCREIADRLGLSEVSVQRHRRRIAYMNAIGER